MRLSLLYLALYSATLVSCEISYAAYERLLYWYAYKLDGLTSSGGVGTMIGRRCPPSSGHKRCTMADFLNCIDDSSPKPEELTDDELAGKKTNHALAAYLQDRGFDGSYDLGKIVNGIPNDHDEYMPTLYDKITKVIVIAKDKLDSDDSTLKNAKEVLNRVRFLRTYAYSKDFINKLGEEGIKPKTQERYLSIDDGDETDKYEFFAMRPTIDGLSDEDREKLYDLAESPSGFVHAGVALKVHNSDNVVGDTC